MTYSHVRYAETGLVKEMRDDVRVVYGPSVNPPESRALHTLAATFLLAFAMLFAAALPAQAQTTIWSATLDPIVTFSGDPVPLGCDNTSGATWQCSNSDRLSDDDFTDDGMTYAVTKFFTKDGVLTFRLDTGATAATQGLTLVIDSEEFVLKEADRINGGKTQWKWNNTTLSWTAGTDVAVSLVVIDAPATGQPTISGAAQVNKTLTAATDYIEDPNGLPTNPTFTYQWMRVDGFTDTDIPGATSETYTLTASDLGKQIKMKVRFTDARGHAEGPLTSDAYPPNGTVVALPGPCPAVNDWCATMTAAEDQDAFGYEYDKFGSLTDDQIEYRGQNINVWTVHTQQEASRDYFYFGSLPRVPLGTVVTVGERTFTTDMESEDGSTSDLWEYPAGQLPPDLVWSDGQEVRVSLVLGSSAPTLSIADASAAENDGHLLFDVTLSPASPHTVKVDFETTSGGTATEGVDYWPHVYTHVIPYGETTVQMGFALIEDAVNAAGETVMVRLSNAREFDAYGNVIRVLNITRAEATGTITAPATTTTTTDVPGLTIRIRDATGDEDDGYLDFRVRLSRKSTDLVCYDFETISGGTATEGMDYLKFPKATYWMQIGKRVDKPFVRIIDDSVNDNDETVKVKISNAHVCGDPSQTVSITRAEATGTIRNSDPLPRALMARFGRATALHVMEQVEERLEASRASGFRGRFAGRELRRGMERDMGRNFLSRLQSTAVQGARDTTGVQSDLSGAELLRRGLGGGDLLMGSGFVLNRETGGRARVSLWSRGMESRFGGQDGELSFDGGVRTTMFGADYAKGPLMAGLMLSHRRGLGGYQGADIGQVASSVTGLHPWVGYQLPYPVTLWGVTGYGRGSLSLTPGEALSLPTSLAAPVALEGGLSMSMLAGGVRGDLVDAGIGGFGLAFKADALWVGTGFEAVAGPAGRLAATEAVVTRVRTALEASRGYVFGHGIALQPSLELGLRRDGGDAETGAGADVAASLIASDPWTGLSVDVRVRTLLVHQDEGFREWGVSVSFSYDLTPQTPLGFTARVAPSWGGQAMSGAEALWGRDTMEGLGAEGLGSDDRIDAELGYALPVGSRLVGTPRFGVTTSEYGRGYRLGYSLAVVQGGAMSFQFGLDAQRRESLGRGDADHSLVGRLTVGW